MWARLELPSGTSDDLGSQLDIDPSHGSYRDFVSYKCGLSRLRLRKGPSANGIVLVEGLT